MIQISLQLFILMVMEWESVWKHFIKNLKMPRGTRQKKDYILLVDV